MDIERYGSRSDADQRWLRQQMYDVLQSALSDAGIDWNTCTTADRGDGVMLLVPPEVPKIDLTDTFVERLGRELARYARRATEQVGMRIRLALHFGEVGQDERGWVGSDLNTAFRLVDLQAARDALRAAPEAHLVVVVSDPWYRSVVNQDPVLVSHFGFRKIPFEAKEISDRAWLHVRVPQEPGRPTGEPEAAAATPAKTPAETAVPAQAPAATPAETPAPTAGQAPTPAEPPRADTIGFQFNAPVQLRDQIAGNQTNYNAGPQS
ncbi:hypothetical protein ACIA8G_27725 [Lentzea sp. NPDC051213]|uniref:hypothetical protein n=1 Tax=Lentzea sp. NPDC051213 TaxID=3364126 RepID=UPI00379D9EF3